MHASAKRYNSMHPCCVAPPVPRQSHAHWGSWQKPYVVHSQEKDTTFLRALSLYPRPVRASYGKEGLRQSCLYIKAAGESHRHVEAQAHHQSRAEMFLRLALVMLPTQMPGGANSWETLPPVDADRESGTRLAA